MARNASCAEAARQRVCTKYVHVESFASMSNTDNDADTESVVVDGFADSVLWDAAQPDDQLRTRIRLEICLTMLVEYGNQGGDG